LIVVAISLVNDAARGVVGPVALYLQC
jgi:hypothetical protein